ncbi:MAG: hypothetical protein V2B20_14730 [Pseudomonadota bacterium]
MSILAMHIDNTNPLLNAVAKVLRATRPRVSCNYYIRLEDVPNGPLLDIWFRTRGCSYDRHGSCTMCNYDWSSPTTSIEQISFVKEALNKAGASPHELLISPSGSMLDKTEVPIEARRGIFEIASKQPCKLFLIETRPETVTEEALVGYANAFANSDTTIGVEMGLESSDQWILNYCVNKQMLLQDFEQAVQVIKRNGMLTYANVSLGTAFLTEQEAIQDSVKAIHWALGKGVDRVVLFPLHVKDFTVLHWLWKKGLHTPTSLWALPEVLKRLGSDAALKVELAWYKPLPVEGLPQYPIPRTCNVCHAEVIQLLDSYKKTMDYKFIELLDEVSCPCHSAWRERLATPPRTSLVDRVFSMYEIMGSEILGMKWWNKEGLPFLEQVKSKSLSLDTLIKE